jgi:hypothetical protein
MRFLCHDIRNSDYDIYNIFMIVVIFVVVEPMYE